MLNTVHCPNSIRVQSRPLSLISESIRGDIQISIKRQPTIWTKINLWFSGLLHRVAFCLLLQGWRPSIFTPTYKPQIPEQEINIFLYWHLGRLQSDSSRGFLKIVEIYKCCSKISWISLSKGCTKIQKWYRPYSLHGNEFRKLLKTLYGLSIKYYCCELTGVKHEDNCKSRRCLQLWKCYDDKQTKKFLLQTRISVTCYDKWNVS
jgi:hypothetical protein